MIGFKIPSFRYMFDFHCASLCGNPAFFPDTKSLILTLPDDGDQQVISELVRYRYLFTILLSYLFSFNFEEILCNVDGGVPIR